MTKNERKTIFWCWVFWGFFVAALILTIVLFSSCTNGRYVGPNIRVGYGDAYVTLQHDSTK